jgi:hypothetical protein
MVISDNRHDQKRCWPKHCKGDLQISSSAKYIVVEQTAVLILVVSSLSVVTKTYVIFNILVITNTPAIIKRCH